MLEDNERLVELVGHAYDSTGASQAQFEKTLESLQTKLTKLKNAWDEFVMGITNDEMIKTGVDFLTNLLTSVNNVISAISGENGLTKSILSLGAAFMALKTGGSVVNSIFGERNKNGLLNGGLTNKIFGTPKDQSEDVIKKVADFVDKTRKKQQKLNSRSIKDLFSINLNKDTTLFGDKDSTKKLETYLLYEKQYNNNKDRADAINKYRSIKNNGSNKDKIQYLNDLTAENNELDVKLGVIDTRLKALNENMQAIGQTASITGAAFFGFGQILQGMGLEKTGEFISTIGMGLVMLGQTVSSFGPILTAVAAKTGLAMGQLLIPIAVIIGVLITISEVYKLIERSTPEYKAEKAAESAKKVTDAYSKLNSTLDTINSVDFNELTKGTLEWYQAVNKVNNAIDTLIKELPWLEKFVTTDENGIKSIDEKAATEYMEKQASATNVVSQITELKSNSGIEFGSVEIDDEGNYYIKNGNSLPEHLLPDSAKESDYSDLIISGDEYFSKNPDDYAALLRYNNLTDVSQEYRNAYDAIKDDPEIQQWVKDQAQKKVKMAEKIQSQVNEMTNQELKDYLLNVIGLDEDTIKSWAEDEMRAAVGSSRENEIQEFNFDDDNLSSQYTSMLEASERKKNLAINAGASEEAIARRADSLLVDSNSFIRSNTGNEAFDAAMDTETAKQLAATMARMEQGQRKLVETQEDWNEVIEKSNYKFENLSEEENQVFEQFKTDVSDMLDLSEDLPDDFFKSAENIELIEDAMNGSAEALAQLKINSTKSLIGDDEGQFKTKLTIKYPDGSEITRIENHYSDLMEALNNISADELAEIQPGLDLTKMDGDVGKLANILANMTGLSAEQVAMTQSYFNSLGVELEELPPKRVVVGWTEGQGRFNIPKPIYGEIFGGFKVKGGKNIGGSDWTKPTTTPTGSGGGSSKDKKWENPYDEYHNTLEQINKVLRDREDIERDYEKLLKNREVTSDSLLLNSMKQIANLRQEVALQEKLKEGRLAQLNALAKETYADDDGNEKTFSSWGVTKYASLDTDTGMLTIDWSGINKITDAEKGGAVEAYIDRLEELQEELEGINDSIDEANDRIEEIKEQGKEEYLSFEDRVYDALINQQQKIIDNYQELSDTLNDSNSNVLDALRESIDLERQIRDNTKTEEDISDKEARLAYLRRDTSGANDAEIRSLEKELADSRQSYGDTLIDQELDRLNDVNEKAQEQREHQIELMQAQLDYQKESGYYWGEVYKLISAGFTANGTLTNNSTLMQLLKETEAFQGMSQFGQMNWISELVAAFAQAGEGYSNWMVDRAEQEGKVTTADGKQLTYDKDNERWYDASGGYYTDLSYDHNEELFKASNYTAYEPPTVETPTTPPQEETTPSLYKGARVKLKKGTTWWSNSYGRGSSGYTGKEIEAEITSMNDNPYGIHVVGNGAYGWIRKKDIVGYKTGGLATSTGLAWLDGTKSKPELVLNARDTENFIQLKNILGTVMKNSNDTNPTSGEVNIEIHINVDELASTYDTEQLIRDVKKSIVEESKYRNVNLINFLR